MHFNLTAFSQCSKC